MARAGASLAAIDSKLRAVRDATRHEFPSAGIDTMLAAIELGYAGSPRQ